MESTRVLSHRPALSTGSLPRKSLWSRRKPTSSHSSLESTFTATTIVAEPATYEDAVKGSWEDWSGRRRPDSPSRAATEERIRTKTLSRPPLSRSEVSTPSFRQSRSKSYSEGRKGIPEDIMLRIFSHLKAFHLEGSVSCATCYLRDLASLGLVCRRWHLISRPILYGNIELVGVDSATHLKRFKIKYGARLTLLRRTLTSRATLANFVKSLKVPMMPESAKTLSEQDDYLALIASVIMACPNLERLPGFYPSYQHEYSKIAHALATRKKLKERVWIIDPAPVILPSTRPKHHRTTSSASSQSFTVKLSKAQQLEFLDYHTDWAELTTMVLHSNACGVLSPKLFASTFGGLRALQHLTISAFPANSFNDAVLAAMPTLTSLRLESLSGITPDGLSHYASLRTSATLQHLSLIDIPQLSLPLLARLFTHLRCLKTFAIVQAASLADVEVVLHPYLASRSLRRIHWEFTHPSDNAASSILSRAIAAKGFPNLRELFVPVDTDGVLQLVCYPMLRVPGIDADAKRVSNGGTADSTGSSMMHARKAAQRRIDHYRKSGRGRITIVAWDEDNKMIEHLEAGVFFGTWGSNVHLDLRDEGDLVALASVLNSSEGSVSAPEWNTDRHGVVRETSRGNICDGSWAMERGSWAKMHSRRGVPRWQHTERVRWKEVRPEELFGRVGR